MSLIIIIYYTVNVVAMPYNEGSLEYPSFI